MTQEQKTEIKYVMIKEWMNKKEAAKYVHYSINTFDELINQGVFIPHGITGRHARFSKAELDLAMKSL